MDILSKYWKTVIDTMQEGLLVVDRRGTIVFVNSAVEKLTGYRKSDIIGKSCEVLCCNGCRINMGKRAKHWCSLFSRGTVKARRCHIKNEKGELVHIIKRGSLLRDEAGEVIGAVETLADISEVVQKEKEIAVLRRTLQEREGFYGMLGKSRTMRQLYDLIDNAAQSEAPVAIHGESGVGKELAAKAIHEAGPRAKRPFVRVSCAALNENLLESELFGHVKGAFTGADKNRMGRFEAANRGDLFMDEIGDIPLSTQVKLLRVLEEKELERVGDNAPVKVDTRIITATNKDLEQLVREGSFREDLFYRINVIPMYIPALRERSEDIPLLAQAFCERISLRGGKSIASIGSGAMELLEAYSWPGNVRELQNTIEYAFVLCRGDEIGPEHLPPKVSPVGRQMAAASCLCPDGSDPKRAGGVPSSDRERLIEALKRTDGRQAKAAELLGISRVTLWKRMKKYGVKADFR